MNAKDRANFINSMQANPSTSTVCTVCGGAITEGDKFCGACGAALASGTSEEAPKKTSLNRLREPAVRPSAKPAASAPAPQGKAYEEQENVFALGLPEWSIQPPQVMVRRKRKV